jgi:transposase
MYTKQEIIIRNYRQGQSQRQIARELHLSRKTARKYIAEYEKALKASICPETAQVAYLSRAPTYEPGSRQKVKLTREVQDLIDSFLSRNEQKKQQGLGKQLMKKKDILEELQKQGFDIGYTTVCNYITGKENRQVVKEAYIRQIYQPGEICEFDWGKIKLYIFGKQVRLQLAVFTSAYSNYRYAFIYHRQDTLSFMESHVRFFEITGGIYREMVYDNMRVAVAKFVGPHEKEPTRALLQLRAHYQFQHRFCNAYRGNEKGHVERSVEYVRRKAFALRDNFTDIQEAQEQLEITLSRINGAKQTGTGQTADELFSKEKGDLYRLPGARLICSDQVQLRADKYATISYRTNRYSVPDHLVGEFVEANIQSEELHIHHQNKRVATHKKSYGKHQWVVDIEHYLSTFKKKPGALAGSLALASNVYLQNLYVEYFLDEPREFIDLLSYCREHKISKEKLEESVRRLLDVGYGTLTVEKLRALLGNKQEETRKNVEDKISLMAKQQLSLITELMH